MSAAWFKSWFGPGEVQETIEPEDHQDIEQVKKEIKLKDILNLIRDSNVQGMKLLLEKTDQTYFDAVFEGTTLLLEAVKIGSLDMVKTLTEMGADVNTGNHISTPLIEAIKLKSIDLVKYLLHCGADINDPDRKNNETPLFHAITNSSSRDTSIVELLLDHSNVLSSPDGKKTALMYAVERDKTCCVACILPHKDLDVNAVDYKKSTALHIAVTKNRYQAAYLICQHPEVDFDKEDGNGLKAYQSSSTSSNRQARTIVQVFSEKKREEPLNNEQICLIEDCGVDIQKLPRSPFSVPSTGIYSPVNLQGTHHENHNPQTQQWTGHQDQPRPPQRWRSDGSLFPPYGSATTIQSQLAPTPHTYNAQQNQMNQPIRTNNEYVSVTVRDCSSLTRIPEGNYESVMSPTQENMEEEQKMYSSHHNYLSYPQQHLSRCSPNQSKQSQCRFQHSVSGPISPVESRAYQYSPHGPRTQACESESYQYEPYESSQYRSNESRMPQYESFVSRTCEPHQSQMRHYSPHELQHQFNQYDSVSSQYGPSESIQLAYFNSTTDPSNQYYATNQSAEWTNFGPIQQQNTSFSNQPELSHNNNTYHYNQNNTQYDQHQTVTSETEILQNSFQRMTMAQTENEPAKWWDIFVPTHNAHADGISLPQTNISYIYDDNRSRGDILEFDNTNRNNSDRPH